MILVMDNAITKHQKVIEAQLQELAHSPSSSEVTRLLAYHDMMTRNFQHERQIHLFITLFFAGLMLASWLLLAVALVMGSMDVALLPIGLLALILTVLEGFYVSYYYRLENRIAKLYPLTDKIYRLNR